MEIKEYMSESEKIKSFYHKDHGTMIRLRDVIDALLNYSGKTDRVGIIEMLIAQDGFIEAASALIAGNSDEEYSHWGNDIDGTRYAADRLRDALTPFAESGAVQLVKHLRDRCNALMLAIKDRDDHIKELKAQWPTGFEKYLPQVTRTYSPSEHLEDRVVQKLIESFSG